LLKTFDFLFFALKISSAESQSKAQFNTLSSRENKTAVYRAENIYFFPQIETSIKVHICLHCLFIPSW